MKQLRSIGIHDGTFHADEVTACALLLFARLIDENKIYRTREPGKLEECEFVCDVGGVYDPEKKLFDHHQVTYQGDLSSAGMVLHYLRDKGYLTEEEFYFFNFSLIIGVDAHDNGRAKTEPGYCYFSHVIANFNPASYEASSDECNKAFFEALHFAFGHIKRLHERFLYNKQCRSIVKKAMESNSLCLYFDRSLSWLESFFSLNGKNHPALFVIMPAGEHWKLRAIPPDYERRMEVRLPLPKEWAGLLGEELKKASNIGGALFCHKGRFTSVWETKEDAFKALRYVLTSNGIKYENNL